MKLLKIEVIPKSSFITFPKGDMIFSYFLYLSFSENKDYSQIMFSDFLPDDYLPRPALPLDAFGATDSEKKESRKKEWITIKNLQDGNLEKVEELQFIQKEINVRNSLNRITFSTDKDKFSPYSLEEFQFLKKPVFYCLYDENEFTEKEIEEVLKLMGKNGFGKKASIGKGQFDIVIDNQFKFDNIETNYYLTISPTILQGVKGYYNTFTKYGKFAFSSTPFKKPVLLADSGAVVKLDEKREYIGKNVENGIKESSIQQGQSILIPFKFKGLENA